MVRKVVINDPMVEVSFNDQGDSGKPVQSAQLSIFSKMVLQAQAFREAVIYVLAEFVR